MTPKVHSEWEGRQPEEHVTNREDELDIQSGASKSGKRDRAVDSGHSQATTEKDHGSQNERAAKDHPEAPKPVIGMNDERGQTSATLGKKDIVTSGNPDPSKRMP
ncbi:hypothetical protein MMC20_005675 [Loxospora ochrophaea]|nr:hypothetical protein [Loxospora ochrophaea]